MSQPHNARVAKAAVLALLHARGGYPSLCCRGIWHAVLTVCAVCGSADGCSCDEYAADAADLLAHSPIVLPALAALVVAGTTTGDAA